MAKEWTRVPRNEIRKYLQHQQVKPIDALTFDTFKSTKKVEQQPDDYKWLCNMVRSMPEDEVNRRMRKTRSTYTTIDEALVDKLIMEGI